jgi:hypothetical protein
MKGNEFFNRVAVSLLIAGISLTGIPSSGTAQQLYKKDRVDGVISRSSPTYRFRNLWIPNTPVEELHGEEYAFNAEEGDRINFNLDIERGDLSPVLVLFHTETNKQMAYSQNNSFTYYIPKSGKYKLLVLAKNNPRNSKYTLEISDLKEDRNDRARDRWDDRQDHRWDNHRDDRQDHRWDNHRDDRRDDRQDDRQDDRRDDRRDNRQQFLEHEFGLRSVDCRLRRSMVRVNFRQDGDNYIVCSEPTRSIPAGNYDYNYRTRNLESKAVEEAKERCRVSIGRTCINR